MISVRSCTIAVFTHANYAHPNHLIMTYEVIDYNDSAGNMAI